MANIIDINSNIRKEGMMANVIIVGSSLRKGSFCPQCRKKVPKENRLENGIKCPRCGMFKWAEFLKYKSLDGVPVPDAKLIPYTNQYNPTDSSKIEEVIGPKKKNKVVTKKTKVKDDSSVPVNKEEEE